MDKDKIIVFQNMKIRRTWFNDEWWFSIVDIVGVLTQTERARKYWSDLKKKLTEEGFELSEKIGQLKLVSSDGKYYLTDCVFAKTDFVGLTVQRKSSGENEGHSPFFSFFLQKSIFIKDY